MRRPVQNSEVLPRPSRAWRETLILLSGLALSLLIAAATLFVVWSGRQAATTEWRGRMSGLAVMVGAHAKQTVEAADDILISIAKQLTLLELSTAEELEAAVRGEEFHNDLLSRIKGSPHIELLAVISRDGFVLNNSLRRVQPYRFSQWDRLKGEILDESADRVFSSAFVSTVQATDEMVIGLGRKIFSNSGKVLGIVGAGIKTGHFSAFYGSLPLTDGYGVSLLNLQGVQLAGSAEYRSWLGQKTTLVEFDEKMRGMDSAVFVSKSPHGSRVQEQVAHLVAMTRIPSISMVAVASVSADVYLAQWRRSVTYFAIGGGSFALALFFLTFTSRRLFREMQQARETALAHAGTKTRFLSAMSHEMRTPLNAIMGNAEFMLNEQLPPAAKTSVATIYQASKHLLSMVNNTLDYARLEVGVYRVEMKFFELRPVLQTIMANVRSLPGVHRLNVRLVVSERAPVALLGSSDVLTQVALNLLSNAVKFTKAGAVELIASYDHERNLLVLEVNDTGSGISPSDRDVIFEAFERGGAAGSIIEGPGLGLTISRRLTESIGGKIYLRPADREGASFVVELPMPARAPERPSRGEALPDVFVLSRPLHVLIVEDVPVNRLLMQIQLQKNGHTVHLAGNGLEALDAMQSERFDAILMDVQMPKMDGLEATRAIRRMPAPAGMIPIIGVTAFSEAEHFAEMREAGMDLCLTKPLEVRDLLDALARKCGAPPSGGQASETQDVSIEDEALQAAFLADMREARDEMAACMSDEAALMRILHKLRGLLAIFGKAEMAQLAADAERSGRVGDAQAVLEAVDELLRQNASVAPAMGSGWGRGPGGS